MSAKKIKWVNKTKYMRWIACQQVNMVYLYSILYYNIQEERGFKNMLYNNQDTISTDTH